MTEHERRFISDSNYNPGHPAWDENKRKHEEKMSKFTQFTFSNGTKAMLSDIEVEDIRSNDYPDFCDAYISYCRVDGEDATDEQLEEINEDSDLVYESVLDWLY